ncbi:type II secretion system protein GspM [Simplicispira psychrophila]|uniref:type II secretion system protein GspM n=1 Tax=Simplicispira psychrophila TaxID=80882 RepID=UPI00048A10DF|nr:type II secretion system protein GspM [Simplicispira psychrophila]
MKSIVRRESAIVVIMLALLALPFMAAGIYIYQKHQWAEKRLDELEPRYARLLGLEDSRETLVQANAQGQASLAQYVYPQGQDINQTGNDAQQRIRSILVAAGLDIASSQVLPVKEDKGFDRIPLSVRAEGEMVALQAALAGLVAEAPAILIDTVLVQGYGAPTKGGVQRLSVQLSLVVLRRHS